MPADERADQDRAWTDDMAKHWRAENDELVNDGGGKYATHREGLRRLRFLVEYRTVPRADSGIYLRGVPQVQIWDYTEEGKFGIGATRAPAASEQQPRGRPGRIPASRRQAFGEWNAFRIIMVGSR